MTQKLHVSDEELEMLAQTYIKLQSNPVLNQMKRTFAVFVDDYLQRTMAARELLLRGRNGK